MNMFYVNTLTYRMNTLIFQMNTLTFRSSTSVLLTVFTCFFSNLNTISARGLWILWIHLIALSGVAQPHRVLPSPEARCVCIIPCQFTAQSISQLPPHTHAQTHTNMLAFLCASSVAVAASVAAHLKQRTSSGRGNSRPAGPCVCVRVFCIHFALIQNRRKRKTKTNVARASLPTTGVGADAAIWADRLKRARESARERVNRKSRIASRTKNSDLRVILFFFFPLLLFLVFSSASVFIFIRR